MNSSGDEVSVFTAAGFRARARERLHAEPSTAIFDPRTGKSWRASDFDLNPELIADLAVMGPPRPAAVLVPVVARGELSVLLTRRTEHLPSHAGQIAFPGGKMEPGDADPIAAALRETEEEIGLAAHWIEPLGFLDSYRTGTGFRIVPVVALVREGFGLRLDPAEVADAFEVPLRFLMDPANHRKDMREWRGRQRYFYAMPFGAHYIWGATAGIVRNMHERLFGA
ncbi:MAG: CoA pyrophosphatase [Hyphomicrobiaceae bacterium]